MISTSKRKNCSFCQKVSEVFVCRGCRQPFCAKHVGKHREKLSKDMNTMLNKCDRLLKDANVDNLSRPIFSRIIEWEKESIERIRQTSKKIREDLEKWFVESRNQLETPLKKLNEEMQLSRKSQDFTEIEFRRWADQLRDFHKMLEDHPYVENLEDNIDDKNSLHFLKFGEKRRENPPIERKSSSKSHDTNGV